MRFKDFKLTEAELMEINMSPTSLKKLSAGIDARAGMEFEMIVPNVEGGSGDADQEPNYDMDERCRSIQDAYDFFYDGDWNSRRSCDEMRDKMRDDYIEWLDEKIATDWDRGGDDFITDWVKNNVDESEWNPDDLEGEARNEALEEYSANVHADDRSDQYQSAYEEFREENQESYDESDWLDDADLSSMSEIENAYSMTWPHWTDPYSGGQVEISDVAQDFENAIGRDTRASSNYHSGSTLRPSLEQQRYIVEPDGSLEPDSSDDRGLEFVSPPLPLSELLSDLEKVQKWATAYGCYTNDSTGLHINVSVPDYDISRLDYVKLSLLLGDEYVLKEFGRMGNTYAKSAMAIVKERVKQNPDAAQNLLDQMRGHLSDMASKAIHSGITSKYTSINTKDGYIEFRSPGGDWLGELAASDKIQQTLLRFVVALDAAIKPELYREEYLKKLYKILEVKSEKDTLSHFARYVAGEIPKQALKSFVRQVQLERDIKRGKTKGQKMWWRVYKDGKNAGRYGAMIEVVAASKEEAIDKAGAEWGLFSQEYKSRMDAEVLRPYDEKPDARSDGPKLNGRSSNPDGNYVIIDQARPTKPVYRYMASDANDALLVMRQWAAANTGTTHWTFTHDPEQSLGQPAAAQTGTGTYELFDRRTGEAVPDTEFTARNQADVNTRLDDYINFGPHGVGTVDARLVFGARPVGSANADQGILPNSLRPTGPGPWEVYNRDTGNSTVNLVQGGRPITDRAQAQRLAMNLIAAGRHDLYGVRTRGTLSGSNIGTQREMEARLGMPSQPDDSNYAVVDRQNLDPVFRFRAVDRDQANRIYGLWLAAAGLPQTTEDYGFQEIRPRSVAQRPSEIQRDWRIVDRATDETLNTVRGASLDQAEAVRADTARRHGVDASQLSLQVIFNPAAAQQEIPEVPLDVAQNFPQASDNVYGATGRASSAPPGNSFSGQWRILDTDTGQELYRFRGVGNSQADANRIAATWLQQNAPEGSDMTQIEVVPVMI